MKTEDLYAWKTPAKLRTRKKPKRLKKLTPEQMGSALAAAAGLAEAETRMGFSSLWTDLPEPLRAPRETKNKKQIHITSSNADAVTAAIAAAGSSKPSPYIASLVLTGQISPEQIARLNKKLRPSRLTLTAGMEQTLLAEIAGNAPDLAAGVVDLGFGVNHPAAGQNADSIWKAFPNVAKLRLADVPGSAFTAAEMVKEAIKKPQLTHLVYSSADMTEAYLDSLMDAALQRPARLKHLQLSTVSYSPPRDATKDTIINLEKCCRAAENLYMHINPKPHPEHLSKHLVRVTEKNGKFQGAIASTGGAFYNIETSEGTYFRETPRSDLRSKDAPSFLGIAGHVKAGLFDRPKGWATGGYYTPQTFADTIGD